MIGKPALNDAPIEHRSKRTEVCHQGNQRNHAKIKVQTGSPPSGGEVGTPGAGLNSWGSLVAAGSGNDNDSESYPEVFVNIVVFDKNYNLLEVTYDGINGGHQVGTSPDVDHDFMKAAYFAREECFVYMYISNENLTKVDVYFDDVVMTHKRSRLIQGSEYYPYGMQTANSWTREAVAENNFLANGGTELNTTTQVYDLYYRNYDPALGRFGQVDPLASQFANFTPYNYGFNDPVFYNDRLGNCVDCECAVCDAPNLFPPGSLPTRKYEGGALTPRDISGWEALQSFAQQSFSRSYAGAQTSGGWSGLYGLVRGLLFDNRIASEVSAKADAMRQASSLGVELDYNKNGEWGWWEDGGNTLEYTFDKNGNLVIIQRPIAKSTFHKLGSEPTILDRIFDLLPGKRYKGSEIQVSAPTNVQARVKGVGGFIFNPYSEVLFDNTYSNNGNSKYTIGDGFPRFVTEFGFQGGWGFNFRNVWESDDEYGTVDGNYKSDVYELSGSFYIGTLKVTWGSEEATIFYGLNAGVGGGAGLGGTAESWDGNVVKVSTMLKWIGLE